MRELLIRSSRALDRWISRLTLPFAALTLLVVMALPIVNLVGRHLLGLSWPALYDLGGNIFFAFVMFSFGYAYLRDGHFAAHVGGPYLAFGWITILVALTLQSSFLTPGRPHGGHLPGRHPVHRHSGDCHRLRRRIAADRDVAPRLCPRPPRGSARLQGPRMNRRYEMIRDILRLLPGAGRGEGVAGALDISYLWATLGRRSTHHAVLQATDWTGGTDGCASDS